MPPAPNLHDFIVAPAQHHHALDAFNMGRLMWAAAIPRDVHEEWTAEMSKAPFSSDGRYQAWSLVRRDDPTGDWYSFVETVRRDGLAKSTDGAVRKVDLYAVTWVMTPEKHRRMGYSRRLLRMIHFLLCPPEHLSSWPSEWGDPPLLPLTVKAALRPGALSYLSSVAPKDFYLGAYIDHGESARDGWIINHDTENSQYSVQLNQLDLGTPEQGWKAVWIYQSDLDSLAPELHQVLRRQLANTDAKPGMTVMRVDPASPGILQYFEYHSRTGGNWLAGRDRTPQDQPVGVRFVRTITEIPTAYKNGDPIALFTPHVWENEDLALTFLDVPPPLFPNLIEVLQKAAREVKNGCPLTRLHGWGLDESDPFVSAVVKSGQGKWEVRSLRDWLPIGVAWYGPPGTSVRFDGLELWAWV